MGRARAPWSDLPKELLEIIAGRLQTKTDITRLRSVCKTWRLSVPPFQNHFLFPHFLPKLEPSSQQHTFLSLTQTTLYYLNQPSPSSSSLGWLVKLREGENDRQNFLINPLSPIRIHPLPDSFPTTVNLSNFRVFEIAKAYSLQFSNLNFCGYKVAFSPNRDRPSLMILACGVLWHLQLFGHDEKWILIDDGLSQLSYDDVILYRGKFCAVDEYGRAVLIDPSSLEVTEIVPQMISGVGRKKSLVRSKGELLLVDRHISHERWNKFSNNTVGFRVYKLQVQHSRWVEVKSLDDQILFLGQDCSFSVPARCFGSRYKRSCIVFADPVFMVFFLDDGELCTIDQHPEYISIFYPPSS